MNAPRLRWSYMYRNMIRHIHTYNVDDLPYTKYVNILLNPVSTEPISPPETPRRQELCLCLCMTLQTFWRSEGRFTNLFFSSTKKSAMQTCVDLTGICSSMFFFFSLSLSPSLPPSPSQRFSIGLKAFLSYCSICNYFGCNFDCKILTHIHAIRSYIPHFHPTHTCSDTWNYEQSIIQSIN